MYIETLQLLLATPSSWSVIHIRRRPFHPDVVQLDVLVPLPVRYSTDRHCDGVVHHCFRRSRRQLASLAGTACLRPGIWLPHAVRRLWINGVVEPRRQRHRGRDDCQCGATSWRRRWRRVRWYDDCHKATASSSATDQAARKCSRLGKIPHEEEKDAGWPALIEGRRSDIGFWREWTEQDDRTTEQIDNDQLQFLRHSTNDKTPQYYLLTVCLGLSVCGLCRSEWNPDSPW